MTEVLKKNYPIHLVLNWKTGDVKVYKKPSKKTNGQYDIPIHFDVHLEIPETPKIHGEVTIQLSRAQSNDIIARLL